MSGSELKRKLVAFCNGHDQFSWTFGSKTTSAFLNVGSDQVSCTVVNSVSKEIDSDWSIFFDSRTNQLRFIFCYD